MLIIPTLHFTRPTFLSYNPLNKVVSPLMLLLIKQLETLLLLLFSLPLQEDTHHRAKCNHSQLNKLWRPWKLLLKKLLLPVLFPHLFK